MGMSPEDKTKAYARIFRDHVLCPPMEAAVMSRRGRPPSGSESPIIRAIANNLSARGRRFEAEIILRHGSAMTVIEFVTICGEHAHAVLKGINPSGSLAREP